MIPFLPASQVCPSSPDQFLRRLPPRQPEHSEQEGILQGTGNIITVEDENGEKRQIEEPEQIHTYQGWKALHRQVKRGEKSIATIQIWKHTTKKPKEADEEEQEKMFLTKAFFFTEAQTEAIAQ